MLSVTVICVGKLKEKFYIDAADEYRKRLGGFCKLELIELPEQRLPQSPAPAQVAAGLEREGEAILARLPKSGKVVALCVEGRPMSSQALSAALDGWMVAGVSQLAFVVGGSYGLSPKVKDRADLRLSMSPMTFPHHLARVMLLEQLYRAFKIREGSDYHK